ncbi:DUF6509 family protein [Fervidibacillus albus]|uniref:DUF6509 family protein n=1 Tax=Fervidibacillus albus TaxID=2980026 RepID=A0A9E8LS89_9BACI|nr:DUF6509 family protein [Fervidibacillus albus]WAA08618.1 DUF6509 family protein [Fervidibacillus albus]
MDIIDYEMERLDDPTGILQGDRFEFYLDIQVPEDDEMYSENGLYIKLIYAVEGESRHIAQYQIFEKTTDTYLPYSLEDEEVAFINQYCQNVIAKGNM